MAISLMLTYMIDYFYQYDNSHLQQNVTIEYHVTALVCHLLARSEINKYL